MNKLWMALVVALAVAPAPAQRTQVEGVFPDMAVMAPGVGSRTEAGIGALIPWADTLWAIGYVSHNEGEGIGLYAIDDQLRMVRKGEAVTGTYANRLVHWESDQAFIGPYAIHADFCASVDAGVIVGIEPDAVAEGVGVGKSKVKAGITRRAGSSRHGDSAAALACIHKQDAR